MVGSRTSNANLLAKSSSNSLHPNSHSGKSRLRWPFHRSRRWKSGSAPLIFTASFHTTDCNPCFGFQWNLTKVDLPAAFTRRKVWTPNPSMKRSDRGMVRSDMIHMTMCIDSGVSVRKSQKRCRGPSAACGKLAIRLLLEGVDHVRELDRVLDEEHRDVVPDQVPIALPSCRTWWRTRGHRGPYRPNRLTAGDRREPGERRRPLLGPS